MEIDKSLKLNRIFDIANALNEQCFIIDKSNKVVFVNEVLVKLYNLAAFPNTNDKLKITFEASSLGYIKINDVIKSCFELKLPDNDGYRLFVLHDEKLQNKSDMAFDKQVLDCIPDILFVHDADFNLLFYNKAGCDFLKPNEKGEIRKQCYKLMGLTYECDDCPAKKSIKTGSINQTLRYFPESNKWFDIRAYPIKNHETKVWRVIEHLRDVTIQKENEIKLLDIEEQKSRLIGNIPGIVYRCKMDKFWTMLFMSQETINITGYTTEYFVNDKHSFNDIIYPDDRKHVYSKIRKSISTNQSFIIEYRIRTKDDQIKYMWEKGKIVIDEDENYIDGVILDITDRKRAEIELANQEEKYRLLVKNQNELIVKVDKHGRITFVNETYCKVFGKTEKELLNESFMPFVYEDDKEMTSKTMLKLLSPPYTCYVEQRTLTINGLRWLAWSDKAILNKNNEIVEIIGVGRDITEKKALELELIKAKNKAEHNEKQKSNFISKAYTNIKAPIDNIILTLLSIKNAQSDPVIYSNILKSALTINSIIDGFTNIVLFNEKDINVIQEKFDINDIFLGLYDIFKNDAKSSNIKFNLDSDTETSNIIVADKVKIQRIILHLLSNSFKNIVDGEISFGYSNNNNNKLILFVKDSSDVISTINFSDFDAITQDIAHNLGGNLDQIDLILAKLYVEHLGGSIKIKKGENIRTEFYVEIPVTKFSPNKRLTDNKPSIDVDLSSTTVLVAEDEEINFHLIKTILTKAGATVIGAVTGFEAIDRVKENKNISIVFMDIKMPGIDGTEALYEIKKIRPELPVIACTAYPQSDELINLTEIDFDGFLPKPIRRDELFEIIEAIKNKKPD
ncbi:MAG: PAS domain-containing protein [Bacteroidales bacterium]|nr:PAS domain-containing protein [Bacteroidales bacterium]MDD4215725.1 PAS domain-containing protein [Bacteroidales bacterium]MDY0140332.1 PAS domain-containing protein [Bacteroidales bacterium]